MSSKNAYKHLTPKQIEEMKQLRYEKGLSNVEISRIMGVTYLTVHNHLGNQPAEMTAMYRDLMWKHLSERRAVQAAIAAKLSWKRKQEEEAERKRQEAIEQARLLQEKRIELRRKHDEALAALKQLEAELAQADLSAAASEEFLAAIAENGQAV